MTIWKYKLEPHGVTTLMMPKGAKVLRVDAQSNVACLWALVAAGRVSEPRKFSAVMTGEDGAPNSVMDYVGTAHLGGGAFVVHVFEVK